jgi:multidrug resistance protein, MATE family
MLMHNLPILTTRTCCARKQLPPALRVAKLVDMRDAPILDGKSAISATSWWRRPCGGREVLRLAIPLIIATASWTVMNFVDRMFLLWHSTDAMAAAMPAGMAHFSLVCFPLGMASYVNTFVAQYKGAGHPQRIGPAVWQGARIGLLCTPLYLALIPVAPWIFRLAGHSGDMARLETLYFQIVAFGAGAEIIAAAISAFFTGLGVNRVVMVVDTTASLMNIVLDYAWIFGRFGLPEWGIEGAAWATVVSLWFRVAAYIAIMSLPRYRQTYRLWTGRSFDAALMRRLWRYGGPNGLQLVIEIAGFTLFLLLVGNLGQDAMAATTLAFNVNTLAFMPMFGLSIALSTLVGQQLGRNQPDLAARAAWTSFWMAVVYMGSIAMVYVLLPDVLLMGHAAGTSPESFASLRATTVILLRFVAAYCLFDAMNVVFAGALKGAGDTRFILATSLLITPLPLLAAWVGIRFFEGGLIWCWVVATLWVSAAGLTYGGRFLQGRWRHMRVIEPDLTA